MISKKGIFVIISTAIILYTTFSLYSVAGVKAAESQDRVGQVRLQQESVQNMFADKYPPESSYIVPSASDAVNVSVTVLQNLSLSIVNDQPKYATNWPYGATLYLDESQAPYIYWTVTADY